MYSHPYIDHLNQYLISEQNKAKKGSSYQTPSAVAQRATQVEILPNTQSTTTKKPNPTTKKKTNKSNQNTPTTKSSTTSTKAPTTVSTTTVKSVITRSTEEQQVLGAAKIENIELVGGRTSIKIKWYQTTPYNRYYIDQDRKNRAGNLVPQIPY